MWFIIGVIAGGIVLAVALWLRSRNIAVTWYEWLIGIVGFILLLFTIQNFAAAFAEIEPGAAWKYWLVMGIPAFILLGIAWQLVARRQRAQS